VISARRTRLVRVADLHRFRRAIEVLCEESSRSASAPRLVVVPTRAAAHQLQRTLLQRSAQAAAATLVSRDELYDHLAARLPVAPRRLSRFEREAIVRSAAAEAIAAGTDPPFHVRPGIVAEIVRFYDQLRRQRQSVSRFEEILVDSLSAEVDLDRGAARMLQQTRFLSAVYRSYERRLAENDLVDEHALRDRLIASAAGDAPLRIILSVADWIADPGGLYHADFDLLARAPGIAAIDVVATADVLASGFHQRLHDWLPGIEEVDDPGAGVANGSATPVLVRPESSEKSPLFVHRDREEELIAVARQIKLEKAFDPFSAAVVFNRPLPYLYLADAVFGAAGIPFDTYDALPLAAEPFAAALDLVLEFAVSQFTRASLVALLRSPHFDLTLSNAPFDRAAIAALDRALSEARYLGELDRLRRFAESRPSDDAVAAPLNAAIAAADMLRPLLDAAPASKQLSVVIEFVSAYSRPPSSDRDRRAQTAVLNILTAMAGASADHDDRNVTSQELATDIRRWIEEETFAPLSSNRGVQLVDAQAARFGDFDDLFVVGLIEGEWPERPRRNVFYPPALLATLGWPSERDRRGAADALFVDLLRSARERVRLSAFSLDDEALVEPSSMLGEAARARLPIVDAGALPAVRIFGDEALSLDPIAVEALDDEARRWAMLRLSRTAVTDAAFHGSAGPRPPRHLSVSSIETYLACPFRYFGQHVLRLEEEPDDDEVMDPKKQGQFIHDVFERFFAEWQDRGRGAITSESLGDAHALFAEIVEELVSTLPEAEAAIERTRLLGSPVAPGFADAVFRMEAEQPIAVVERLLEYRLRGEFEFVGSERARTILLDGVADRLDLLADGTVRLIDYKLSSAPQRSRALQLPVYAICAEQRLEGHRGRRWTVGEAAYVAFRGAKRVAPLFTIRSDRDRVLRDAQDKLIAAVDAIEAGEFPPTPDDVFLCSFCSFGAVCRKDYVGDV
jgi:RecB family exonuclease